nr:unnamed protein product [Digitaria exilis]
MAAASLFGADRRLCSADILAPDEVRARIEVAVLNFLTALTSPTSPAISVLPLVMEMCYKILGEGKLVNQRELFYKLLSDSRKYFSCQRHM